MQMRFSTYRLLACMAVVVLAGLPGAAAADEWDSCVKLSDDLAVAGCSRAIDSQPIHGSKPRAAVCASRRGVRRHRATSTAQWRITTSRCGSIRRIRLPTTTAATFGSTGATSTGPSRTITRRSSSIRNMGRLRQPRQRLGVQGRLRPGHRGLRPGDPARSERC